jgi:very-short-patch-repair endonuclease
VVTNYTTQFILERATGFEPATTTLITTQNWSHVNELNIHQIYVWLGRCGDKIYYGDFFFHEKMLLVELDGMQHIKTTEYDNNRDKDILNYHGVTTFRITYKEYKANTKTSTILSRIK